MQIKTNRQSGFTLVEIMIVVAIIGLLAAIAIPNFVKARTQSQANSCINNLRQVEGAKQQWALEKKAPATATPTAADVTPYMGRGAGQFPTCPIAGAAAYAVNALDTAAQCPTYDAVEPLHKLPN